MSTIILQRYANREYRLAHQDIILRTPCGGDKYAENQVEKYAKAVHDTYVLGNNIHEGAIATQEGDRFVIEKFGEVAARQALRSLDIINEFHLPQKVVQKGGWGNLSKPTCFTKNARHRLLEAGAIVDKFCGLNAYEITCTLPGSTGDAMLLLAENTGWMMNELTREIRKVGCKYWFYVWELQKRGALHLHICVADPILTMENLAKRLEARWWELLESISSRTKRDAFSRRTGGTWRNSPIRWQSHVAPIQKSVAAYFSKYAGKGSSSSCKSKGSSQVFCPSRWWGCSTEIKAQIKLLRRKWKISVSNSTSLKIKEYLETWLADIGRIKQYSYEFQLGKTRNGTELGGGSVSINYYTSPAMARLQMWEDTMWEGVLAIARDCGEYEDPTQTWTNADMACPSPLYADMAQRRCDLSNADMQSRKPSPSPHSQPSSFSRKLSKARGTQPEATLALRARLVQFLAGGNGEASTKISDDCQDTGYIQGELFNKNYYQGIDRIGSSYEFGEGR